MKPIELIQQNEMKHFSLRLLKCLMSIMNTETRSFTLSELRLVRTIYSVRNLNILIFHPGTKATVEIYDLKNH